MAFTAWAASLGKPAAAKLATKFRKHRLSKAWWQNNIAVQIDKHVPTEVAVLRVYALHAKPMRGVLCNTRAEVTVGLTIIGET